MHETDVAVIYPKIPTLTSHFCTLQMIKVGFAYPGQVKKTLTDVSIYITLSSRVAVLGANGAGKSTMIKLLTGESSSCSGCKKVSC